MKKRLFLLPLSFTILTACNSGINAPIENADGVLSPGMMQPVGNNGGSWQPEIQQTAMPSMGSAVPTGTQTPQPNFQPTYPQASANYAQQPVQPAQVSARNMSECIGTQTVNVPRNPNTNAPDYSQIQKGSYKGSTYKVGKGDTMFLIAYLAGIDVKELAAINNMAEPYHLSIGQTLKISNCVAQPVKTQISENPRPSAPQSTVTYTAGANGTQIGSDGTIIGPVKSGTGTPTGGSEATAPQQPIQVANPAPIGMNAPITSNVPWQWPVSGNIIQGFSNSDGGNKGIDIGGSRGQAVKAAASGRVVYAGNALRGYGNLIIIKHNDDFLSAYAHNDKLLVTDQQEVRAGQEIAKMGSSGTNAVKLHFEIRYTIYHVNSFTLKVRSNSGWFTPI